MARQYLDVKVRQVSAKEQAGLKATDGLFKKLGEVRKDDELIDIVVTALMKASYVVKKAAQSDHVDIYGWRPPDDDDET